MLDPKTIHPNCQDCGWRKGGPDSWNGTACKCGHHAQPIRRSLEADVINIGDRHSHLMLREFDGKRK